MDELEEVRLVGCLGSVCVGQWEGEGEGEGREDGRAMNMGVL